MSQDDLEPLPSDLQHMLRQGRPGYDPPPGSREAALSFVAKHAALLGAAALVHGAAHASHASSVAGRGALGRAWVALKGSIGIGGLVVGAAAGAMAGAAGHAALVNRPVVSAPAVTARLEPTVTASAAPAASLAPEAVIAASPSSSAAMASPPQAAVPSAVRVDEVRANGALKDEKDPSLAAERAERALIDMARTAVARGQGEAALDPLERHGREFPRGRLTEEREWLAIQALLLTGRTDVAKERASRFRRAYPRSLMLPALDQVLPSQSPP
jgi:hypothetical protein